MKNIRNKISDVATFNLFGLCTLLADKMGLNVDRLRIYFIYSSFLMLGSPVLLYLLMSFALECYTAFRRPYRIWDL